MSSKMLKTSLKSVLVVFVFAFSCVSSSAEQNRPNIILVLTDDQSYGMLGVTGNDIVQTPNIDALAKQGVLFTNAHVTSAICTPSRVSLLLGQYERKHSVNFNSGTAVSEQAWAQSYPVRFKHAGYYTGWIGKNHTPVGPLGYESGIMEKSFDYWYAGNGHIFFYPKRTHAIFNEAKSFTQAEILEEGVDDFLDTNEHKFERAIKFLDKRPANKPFMLSINFNLPHGASTSRMEMLETDDEMYRTKYRDKTIPPPKHYVAKADIQTAKLHAALLHVEDRQSVYDYVDNPETNKERYIRQLQAMTGIDRLIGNMRKMLEEQGIAENTVILFTSDHGLFMGEFGLGGKALCYEKNTHVPLIIYGPRKQALGKSDALVLNIDLAPTMLSLAGIDKPSTMQGEDISDAIYQLKPAKREFVFTENLWSTHFGNPRCEAIQDNQWKYIRYYENNNLSANDKLNVAIELDIPVNKMLYGIHDNQIAVYRNYLNASLAGEPAVYEELYHIASDPDETRNLAMSKNHKQKLEQMRNNWRPVIEFARGKGSPNVSRYTIDLQLESGVKAKSY